MILSDRDLRKLLSEGLLRIDPIYDWQIGPTSIDLHLGESLTKYSSERLELGRTAAAGIDVPFDERDGYVLAAGGFILGVTLEKITMPNGYQGFIETKGDVARAGLQVHNGDGHVDPGSDHVITLEISNHNTIPLVLYPRILVCQLFVHRLTSKCDRPYCGKYLHQVKPSIYQLTPPREASVIDD